MIAEESPAAALATVPVCEFRTTAGVIALVNLRAQIEGLQRRGQLGLLSMLEHAELIDLVAQRGHILGRIADYEWAGQQAERLVEKLPKEGVAYLARAKARSRFHRFSDAVADLDRAEQLGADSEAVNSERGGILQAIGDYKGALSLFQQAADCQTNFASLVALATFHSDLRETEPAERLFDMARNAYCGVSPIPLALLDFQRGHMWMGIDDLERARHWFGSAVRLLPDFAPAQGHLAEVEAEFGETECAVNRLQPLTKTSDDPDYCAELSRILREAGRVEEADDLRAQAVARYDELILLHPAAFADHAAAFWLEIANDPQRALPLAKLNLDIRQTPRAQELFDHALQACERSQAPGRNAVERLG